MSPAIWNTEKGTFLRVIVRPNSREKRFVTEKSPDTIVVNLKNPAREGKANSELVKRLARALKTSTASVTIVAGHKSKEKTVLVLGLSPAEVDSRLSDMT
ncbi:MAG: DUF167 domain-containing protein [Promethearchaeota archaeon]